MIRLVSSVKSCWSKQFGCVDPLTVAAYVTAFGVGLGLLALIRWNVQALKKLEKMKQRNEWLKQYKLNKNDPNWRAKNEAAVKRFEEGFFRLAEYMEKRAGDDCSYLTRLREGKGVFSAHE